MLCKSSLLPSWSFEVWQKRQKLEYVKQFFKTLKWLHKAHKAAKSCDMNYKWYRNSERDEFSKTCFCNMVQHRSGQPALQRAREKIFEALWAVCSLSPLFTVSIYPL